MNLGPPEDNNPRKKKEGRLTFTQLIQEAGLRDENWKRKEGVSGELYETSLVGLHEQIYEAFKNHYIQVLKDWAAAEHLNVITVCRRDPCLLKSGSIATSGEQFAVLIPLPPLQCEVQYLPDRHDPSTRQSIDWLHPILLPKNSALIVKNGEMKFELYIFECQVTNA